jgi:hypothetical protein
MPNPAGKMVSSSLVEPRETDKEHAAVALNGDAPPGRQRFRRSEIPTCHPGWNGTHNKSDILLVSSTFADPGFPLW